MPGEDLAEYQRLIDEVLTDLKPVGTLEHKVVERIAIALWRQRRLVRAERAQMLLIQHQHTHGDDPWRSPAIDPRNREKWSYQQIQSVLSELQILSTQSQIALLRLVEFAKSYSLVHSWFRKQDFMSPEEWLETKDFTLGDVHPDFKGWVLDQCNYWRGQVPEALNHELYVVLAETKKLSRYQSSLGNEQYKAMRALRQAQAWRRDVLEPDV
jgi:hypothetical protein